MEQFMKMQNHLFEEFLSSLNSGFVEKSKIISDVLIEVLKFNFQKQLSEHLLEEEAQKKEKIITLLRDPAIMSTIENLTKLLTGRSICKNHK